MLYYYPKVPKCAIAVNECHSLIYFTSYSWSCMFTLLPAPTSSIMSDKFVYSSRCLLDVCMLGSYNLYKFRWYACCSECLCHSSLFCFINVRFPWLYSTYMVPSLHIYAVPTYLCNSNLFCSLNMLPVPTCCPLWFHFHDWAGFHTDYYGFFVCLSIITIEMIEMGPLMVSLVSYIVRLLHVWFELTWLVWLIS